MKKSRFSEEQIVRVLFVSLAHAAWEIEKWRREYNGVRPHCSLKGYTLEGG